MKLSFCLLSHSAQGAARMLFRRQPRHNGAREFEAPLVHTDIPLMGMYRWPFWFVLIVAVILIGHAAPYPVLAQPIAPPTPEVQSRADSFRIEQLLRYRQNETATEKTYGPQNPPDSSTIAYLMEKAKMDVLCERFFGSSAPSAESLKVHFRAVVAASKEWKQIQEDYANCRISQSGTGRIVSRKRYPRYREDFHESFVISHTWRNDPEKLAHVQADLRKMLLRIGAIKVHFPLSLLEHDVKATLEASSLIADSTSVQHLLGDIINNSACLSCFEHSSPDSAVSDAIQWGKGRLVTAWGGNAAIWGKCENILSANSTEEHYFEKVLPVK